MDKLLTNTFLLKHCKCNNKGMDPHPPTLQESLKKHSCSSSPGIAISLEQWPTVSFSSRVIAGAITNGHILNKGHLRTFQDLHERYNIPNTYFFKYLRVHHTLASITWSDQSLTTDIIQFYDYPSPSSNRSKFFFKMLNTPQNPKELPLMEKWEQTLNFSADSLTWFQALHYILKTSGCLSHWETAQKILHQWYLTPTILVKFASFQFLTCWRKCGHTGTTDHIWWSCPLLSLCWKSIQALFTTITGNHPKITPQLTLLGLGLEAWESQPTPSSHVLIAARLAIAKSWNSTLIPSPQLNQNIISHKFQKELMLVKANFVLPNSRKNGPHG